MPRRYWNRRIVCFYAASGADTTQKAIVNLALVPALGYLDKINELIVKAQKNELTQAEFLILKGFDLAELSAYEQAKELTIELLKKWLVKYKFKKWTVHQTTPNLIGRPVTDLEKIARAEDIVDKLSNNNHWKSL